MFRSRQSLLCGLLAALALTFGSGGVPASVIASAAAYSGITIDQAVKMVEQRYRARVVKAEAQNDAGHTVYVLRLLNESGQVWTVHVDAASGAVQ